MGIADVKEKRSFCFLFFAFFLNLVNIRQNGDELDGSTMQRLKTTTASKE